LKEKGRIAPNLYAGNALTLMRVGGLEVEEPMGFTWLKLFVEARTFLTTTPHFYMTGVTSTAKNSRI
jgi:hypothetical protein